MSLPKMFTGIAMAGAALVSATSAIAQERSPIEGAPQIPQTEFSDRYEGEGARAGREQFGCGAAFRANSLPNRGQQWADRAMGRLIGRGGRQITRDLGLTAQRSIAEQQARCNFYNNVIEPQSERARQLDYQAQRYGGPDESNPYIRQRDEVLELIARRTDEFEDHMRDKNDRLLQRGVRGVIRNHVYGNRTNILGF